MKYIYIYTFYINAMNIIVMAYNKHLHTNALEVSGQGIARCHKNMTILTQEGDREKQILFNFIVMSTDNHKTA